MRYFTLFRYLIFGAVEWLQADATDRENHADDLARDQSQYQDDLFYIAFLGPHV